MSPDPNPSSHLSKSAASAQSQTKAEANVAPEPSSPAEPMTDQTPKSILVPPPTRIVPPEPAPATEAVLPDAAKPDAAKPAAAKLAKPAKSAAKLGSQPPAPRSAPQPPAADALTSDAALGLETPVEMPAELPDATPAPAETQAELPVESDESPELADAPAALAVSEVIEPPVLEPPAMDAAPEPEATAPESATVESALVPDPASQPAQPAVLPLRQQPIPPASEPMQYRAIGLVRGKYMPSEEQFTRGFILTDDEVLIDSVLLGRVMSLVKKHINLDESHLWVVYPRTREKDLDLHMQIVGVWEPDKLNRTASAELAEEAAEEAAEPSAEEPVVTEDLDDRYFSVRGEVVYQSDEEERLLVKIRRAPKPGETEGKAFKVALKGVLQGKALGYFWEMQVQRQNSDLLITEAVQIAMVPPQKRGPGSRGGRPPRRGAGGPPRRGAGGPPQRRWDNSGWRTGCRPGRRAG